MIFKPLQVRDCTPVETIGYGNAFRWNNRLYLLCSSSKDVPLKDDEWLFGMDTGGQISKIPRKTMVESVPTVLLECKDWDEANSYL